MNNDRIDAMRNLITQIDIENHEHGLRMDSMIEEFLGLLKVMEDTTDDEERHQGTLKVMEDTTDYEKRHQGDTNTDKEEWNSERFANEILTNSIRSVYEENHGSYVEEIYKRGAEIMNITSGMNLHCQSFVKHIFWFAGNKRLFGINLFSKRPVLTVVGVGDDITEEVVKQYVSNEDFTLYPQYSQLAFKSTIKTEKLKNLFGEIYLRRSSLTDKTHL